MQRIEIIGRLGKEIELKTTSNGKNVVEFSIAETEKQRNGDGLTTWFDCVAWDKKAETLSRFLIKGDVVYIYGRERTQDYQAKDGSKRTKRYILVDGFEFLPNNRERIETKPSFEETSNFDFTQDDLPFM